MLKDDKMGLALSALVVALVYAGLVWWLRQRRGERLLTEAYGALALGFATLAVPLAFSASTTASLWALEGAGASWIGLRQKRTFPWLAASVAAARRRFLLPVPDGLHDAQRARAAAARQCRMAGRGAAGLLRFRAVADPRAAQAALRVAALLFAWAAFWWLVGGLTQLDLAKDGLGQWRFAMLYVAIGMAARRCCAIGCPGRGSTGWSAAPRSSACCWCSPRTRTTARRSRRRRCCAGAPTRWPGVRAVEREARTRAQPGDAHLAGLWTLALALSMQFGFLRRRQRPGAGLEVPRLLAPVALMTLALWRRPRTLAWPRADAFAHYRLGWFGLAVPLLAWAFCFGLFLEGSRRRSRTCRCSIRSSWACSASPRSATAGRRLLADARAAPLLAAVRLRLHHHGHAARRAPSARRALVRSGARVRLHPRQPHRGLEPARRRRWILGSRSGNRQVWMGGAVLMGIVLLKLITSIAATWATSRHHFLHGRRPAAGRRGLDRAFAAEGGAARAATATAATQPQREHSMSLRSRAACRFRTAAGGAAFAAALSPKDFARQWPVQAPCPAGAANCEGAFAVTLDESVYRQVRRTDLGDLAAFNAAGEAMPFGPMPKEFALPPGEWREAPGSRCRPRPTRRSRSGRRGPAPARHAQHGRRAFARRLAQARPAGAPQDILVDVREKKRVVEAIVVEPQMDAADFSLQVAVEASEDLQHWRTLVPAATLAHLRQGGQALLRSRIEFAPERTDYLRLRLLDGKSGIPLRKLRLFVREPGAATAVQPRARIAADFVRREGRAYVYALPARVPVERVDVVLGDDNAIASFSVMAREPGEKNWDYVGQMESFRLRAAGVQLDNEPLDIAPTRRAEWRIESNTELRARRCSNSAIARNAGCCSRTAPLPSWSPPAATPGAAASSRCRRCWDRCARSSAATGSRHRRNSRRCRWPAARRR
jgi:hypothetical protein